MIIETKVKGDTIFFNDESHRFWRMEKDKKVAISSVTTFTGVIDKSTPLIIWATRLTNSFLKELLKGGTIIGEEQIDEACKQHQIKKQEAADIGTQIHLLVSAWIKKEEINIPDDLDPRIRNGFDAFLKFQQEHKAKWVESEKIVYNPVFEYAGILDAVAEIDGKLVLVDFKSSNGLYPEHAFQAAAYQDAYQEMTGKKLDHRLIIRFGKEDGEFEVKKYEENDKDFLAFVACLNLKKRLKELDTWKK